MNHLLLFQAVAEEESVSRGARKLFISQPAVSKQLAEFERALGTRLFDRQPRGMRLTEAGEVLLTYARRLQALEQEAEEALAALEGLERGRLAIGAGETIGGYLLPGILAAFRRRHPAIDLHLEIASTDVIERRLLDGTLDIGLTEETVVAPDLSSEIFLEDEIVAIAAPRHPILPEMPVPIRRFCREPFLVRESGFGVRTIVDRALAERGLSIRPILSLGSAEAIKRAVTGGAGVAFVSRLTIGLEIEAGRLSIIDLTDFAVSRSLARVQPRGKAESRAVVAFKDRMRRSLNSRSWKAYQML